MKPRVKKPLLPYSTLCDTKTVSFLYPTTDCLKPIDTLQSGACPYSLYWECSSPVPDIVYH